MDPTPEGLSPEPETPAVADEEGGSRSPSKSFVQRLTAVFQADSSVFAEIAEDSDTWTQALLVAVIAAVAGCLPIAVALPVVSAVAGPEGALPLGFVSLALPFVAAPATLIGLGIQTWMLRLAMKLLSNTAPEYSGTYRVLAFALAPHVLGIVPVIGWAAASPYSVVLQIVAVTQIARVSIGRAIGIWLTSLVIWFAIVLAVSVLVFLAVAVGALLALAT